MGKKAYKFYGISEGIRPDSLRKFLPNFHIKDMTVKMVFPSSVKKGLHAMLLYSTIFLFILQLLFSTVFEKVLIKFQRE